MLDIERIRNNPNEVRNGLKRRGADISLVDEFLDVDKQWRSMQAEVQELRHQQKESGKKRDIETAKELKEKIKNTEQNLRDLEKKRHELLITFPNIPFDDVPDGGGEEGNVSLREVGAVPTFAFDIRDHLALGEMLDIIDTAKAAEVSGARFYYLKNEGALLEFALVRFVTDILVKEGFIPVIPPVMIRPDVYEKMGRLTPDQRDERYYLGQDDLYLVGSAEHTLGPLHMDDVLDEDDLPRRYAGFSTCFRREAGSYGKDTRGILRVHQFDKLEMYVFADPKHSEEEHKFLLDTQEKIYAALNIPYRVMSICTGDMGPTDARQFDIEAWIPSQNKYREVTSCSNTTDYQTRGIKTKVRRQDGTAEYAHALNATAVAISRTLIAILENNQRKDGTVIVPKSLRKYTGFKTIAPKKRQ